FFLDEQAALVRVVAETQSVGVVAYWTVRIWIIFHYGQAWMSQRMPTRAFAFGAVLIQELVVPCVDGVAAFVERDAPRSMVARRAATRAHSPTQRAYFVFVQFVSPSLIGFGREGRSDVKGADGKNSITSRTARGRRAIGCESDY